MKCEEFHAAFLEGDLTEAHFAHLSSCETCRSEQSELAATAQGLEDADVWARPPADLGDAVVATVQRAATAETRTRGAWLWFGVAAAVIVIGAAAVFGALSGRPDWTVTLDATDLAPGATASISGWNSDAGTRVSIDASGLDPAPDGFVYELWFSSPDQHISAGTFASADGVTGWVGVRRSDYPRLWITLEDLTGDTGPSRSTVLDTGF